MVMLKLKCRGNKRWNPAPDFVPFMKKRGYTMVLHEALELIIDNDFDLTKNEMQVALAVIRKTWGFQHWEDRISLSQIQKLTGIDTRTISRCLNSLEKMAVLLRTAPHCWRHLKATGWSIERDTSKWFGRNGKGQSTPRANHVTSPRANHTPIQGVNRPTTRDTVKDKGIYTRTADKEAEALKRLRQDGRYAV